MSLNTPREQGELRKAVALRYERAEDAAPRVVAQGQGTTADTILSFARAHAVPVHEDRDLVELLAGCELGAEISPELFDVVARLLVYLYRTNQCLARVQDELPGAGTEEAA